MGEPPCPGFRYWCARFRLIERTIGLSTTCDLGQIPQIPYLFSGAFGSRHAALGSRRSVSPHTVYFPIGQLQSRMRLCRLRIHFTAHLECDRLYVFGRDCVPYPFLRTSNRRCSICGPTQSRFWKRPWSRPGIVLSLTAGGLPCVIWN